MICTVPYDEGQMLRFSATYDVSGGEEAEDALMGRLKERLAGIKFNF